MLHRVAAQRSSQGGCLAPIRTVKTPYIGKTLNQVVELAMSFVADQNEGPAMKAASRKTATARA